LGNRAVQTLLEFVDGRSSSYTVLSCASEIGLFAALAGDGARFSAGYDSNDVTLTAL
jgi:hypothetical protein